ncbi:MAG: Ig-like domain-containing domain, partial [Planctomycetota bacterium]
MPSEAPTPSAGSRPAGARPRRRNTARWAGLALALSLASCDNPSCAFTVAGCFESETPGALGAVSSLPTEGALVLPGLPQLVSATPNGQVVNSETPIVLTFSESLAPQDVANAFSLTSTTDFGEQPVPFSATGLAGGQVIVLLPLSPLPFAQDVRLNYVGEPELVDLTGQSLELNPGSLVASFSVATVDAVIPELVTTFPADNATGQAPNSSYLAFFDRPMDASSVGDSSWIVQVDGVDPTFDPDPVALEVQAGPFPVQDTRVWSWTSVDGSGDPVSLGLNVEVSLTLSPATAPLTDAAGEALATAEVSFRTASFGAPFNARITSTPDDAIGIAGLTPGGDDDLALALNLEGAQVGDILDIYAYGFDLIDGTSLVSVLRQRELTATDDLLDLGLGLTDLELTTSTDPLAAIFADGDVTFAFGLRRGNDVSVLHLLDIGAADGVQSPVLDTLAPTLVDLAAPGGGGDLFASDLRDLVVMGFASEPLRSVHVTT